uniref:Uncharacterized protein n=1 Tax=Meloidogyne hapla TaxID=6305 RepID=A0A1I8C057_MELHA
MIKDALKLFLIAYMDKLDNDEIIDTSGQSSTKLTEKDILLSESTNSTNERKPFINIQRNRVKSRSLPSSPIRSSNDSVIVKDHINDPNQVNFEAHLLLNSLNNIQIEEETRPKQKRRLSN